MVKVKKKKGKKAKRKPTKDMFAKGGLNLLLLGGFVGIFYQTLYLLITIEAIEEPSLEIFERIFWEMGTLFLFIGLVLACFHFLKEEEFFKKHTGSFLVSGAVLSLIVTIYSQYDVIIGLKDQTIVLKSFVTAYLPKIMGNFSRLYIFLGVSVLGIYFWGRRKGKRVAAEFLIAGCTAGVVALVIYVYNGYDTYKMFLEMYSIEKEMVISRFLFPDILNHTSRLLVLVGVLLFSASVIWAGHNLRKWTGRAWFFGGILGAFHGFVLLSLDSEMIHNEISGVRQSIMELTPYSTTLKDNALVIETLKEFYVKKMIPTYMDQFFWIAIFTGIAAVAVYFWVRK
jgi:hypothetical protein